MISDEGMKVLKPVIRLETGWLPSLRSGTSIGIGDGSYELSKDFNCDGLYFVKGHASNKNFIIMLQKLFVVGDLSYGDLENLQKDTNNNEVVHQYHH